MFQIITLTMAMGSLAGIVFFVYRKLPELRALPMEEKGAKGSVVGRARDIVSSRGFGASAKEKVLGRTLTGARFLASKTETRTEEWLDKLRQHSVKRREEFEESYWEQLHKKPKK